MSNIDIRALLGVPKHANQHRLSHLTMEVHTDELRIMASAVESYTDELIAALEAAEKRIAELSQKADIYDMLRQDYGLQGSLVEFVDWQAKRIAEMERELVAMEAVTLAMRDDMRAAAWKGE